MTLRQSLVQFHNEAVCPVRRELVAGFISGAQTGWGWARIYVGRLLEKFPDERSSSIPSHALCLFKDGNSWACVRGDFQNLQESPSAFGDTPEEAMREFEKLGPIAPPWVNADDHVI